MRLVSVLLAMCLVLLAPAQAEEIRYKDGTVIEGEVVDENDTYIYVMSPAGDFFNVEKSRLLQPGEAPPEAAPKVATTGKIKAAETDPVKAERDKLALVAKTALGKRQWEIAEAGMKKIIEFEKTHKNQLSVQLNQYALAQLYYCTEEKEKAIPVLRDMYSLGLKEDVIFYYFWAFITLYKHLGIESADQLRYEFTHNQVNSKKRETMKPLFDKDRPSEDNQVFLRKFCKAYYF